MRAQRAVLREIADRNLNPNVAYIAGKDGQLREKKPSIENSVPAVTLSVESIKTIEVVVEQVSTVDQAATETFVEEIPAAEDTKPKKKGPSKKKETLSTDE